MTALTVFAAAMIAPAFSFVVNPDQKISESLDCDEPVSVMISQELNAVGNSKASGDDYELPFIPNETDHVWDDGRVTKQPTCTKPGVITYTCKINSKHTYTEEIPATGHTLSDPVEEDEIAPTCDVEGGKDEVVFCSVCGAEISRNHITIPALGHNWGEWVRTKEPTETQPGEEKRTCGNDLSHTETREVPPLGPLEVRLSFFDDEIIIIVPNGAKPDNAEFDVKKIVPPPEEVVGKVNNQMGASTGVIAYYEIRLIADDSSSVIYLDGEITVKVKMPERLVGSKYVRNLQQDESGKLIEMNSWWEGEYLCYNTDWLEIYN